MSPSAPSHPATGGHQEKGIFHWIRHGESVSNVFFAYDDVKKRFEGPKRGTNPVVKSGGHDGRKHITGDHFLRAVLSPHGIAQCVLARQGLERAVFDAERDRIGGIFSSPLERTIETAILTTPPDVLKKVGYKITVVPQIQEVIKYQCDLVSSQVRIQAHADRTRMLYVRLLERQERRSEADELARQDIRIDWGYWGQGKKLFQVLTETPEMIEARADSAQKFFREVAKKHPGESFLVFSHGQITTYVTGLYDIGLPKCERLELDFVPEQPGPPALVDSPHNKELIARVRNAKRKDSPRGDLDSARKDARIRVSEGCEGVRIDAKKRWIEAMGRHSDDAMGITRHDVPQGYHREKVRFPPRGDELPRELQGFFLTSSLPGSEERLQGLADWVIRASKSSDVFQVDLDGELMDEGFLNPRENKIREPGEEKLQGWAGGCLQE